jgi:hypothetical protein
VGGDNAERATGGMMRTPDESLPAIVHGREGQRRATQARTARRGEVSGEGDGAGKSKLMKLASARIAGCTTMGWRE